MAEGFPKQKPKPEQDNDSENKKGAHWGKEVEKIRSAFENVEKIFNFIEGKIREKQEGKEMTSVEQIQVVSYFSALEIEIADFKKKEYNILEFEQRLEKLLPNVRIIELEFYLDDIKKAVPNIKSKSHLNDFKNKEEYLNKVLKEVEENEWNNDLVERVKKTLEKLSLEIEKID